MRLYNGCPDKELQALLDSIHDRKIEVENAIEKIKKVKPEICITYHHPHGGSKGGYVVHEWGNELSGYHNTQLEALNDALERIEESP